MGPPPAYVHTLLHTFAVILNDRTRSMEHLLSLSLSFSHSLPPHTVHHTFDCQNKNTLNVNYNSKNTKL